MQEKSSSKKELFGGNIGGASLSLLLQDESFLFVALKVFSIDRGMQIWKYCQRMKGKFQ